MSVPVSAISEPCVVTTTFADGLHSVEVDRHGIARLVLYAEQRETYGGAMERVVVARLLLPGAVLSDVAARLLAAERAPRLDPYAEERRGMN